MNDATIYLLRMLIPHVQTALMLRSRLDVADVVNLFSEAALDAMSIAAFLVSGDGRIRHMNRLAAGYPKNTAGLRSRHGRLTATDAHKNVQLQFLIGGACGKKGTHSLPGGANEDSAARGADIASACHRARASAEPFSGKEFLRSRVRQGSIVTAQIHAPRSCDSSMA